MEQRGFGQMSSIKKCFLGLMVVMGGMVGTAFSGTVGTTTADILKINYGARPAGMAGAYTAMCDDSYSANYYNPAGLAGVRSPEVILLHSSHLADIKYEYLAFSTPWGAQRTLAFHLNYRHMSPIDNNNAYSPATASDVVASLSAAQRYKDFNFGVTAKYINSSLDDTSGTAYALDLGTQYSGLPYNFKAGLAILNFGTKMTFVSESEPLPLFIRVGLAWTTMIKGKKRLNLDVDVIKPTDQPLKMCIGGEMWLFEKLFAVRIGDRREQITKDPGNLFHNYTLGFTLTRPIKDTDMSFDFAFNPAAYDLTTEDTYFAALSFRFNHLKIF
jgi:hypothetical protein